jgi:hypothetical protein
MDITFVLAHLFGIVFAILGLSMALNKKWTTTAIGDIFMNQGIVWIAGLITLLLGATVVTLNNVWTSGLPFWISVLGWLTLIKGATILLFPRFTHAYYKKMISGDVFIYAGILVFVLGMVLVMQ